MIKPGTYCYTITLQYPAVGSSATFNFGYTDVIEVTQDTTRVDLTRRVIQLVDKVSREGVAPTMLGTFCIIFLSIEPN